MRMGMTNDERRTTNDEAGRRPPQGKERIAESPGDGAMRADDEWTRYSTTPVTSILR